MNERVNAARKIVVALNWGLLGAIKVLAVTTCDSALPHLCLSNENRRASSRLHCHIPQLKRPHPSLSITNLAFPSLHPLEGLFASHAYFHWLCFFILTCWSRSVFSQTLLHLSYHVVIALS